MKFDRHGLRFRLMCAFMFLAVSVIFLLGVLQLSLIRPYFRQTKTEAVKEIAIELKEQLLSNHGGSKEDVDAAFRQAVESNACVVICDPSGKQIYNADMLGAGCVFNGGSDVSDGQNYHDTKNLIELVNDANGEFSVQTTNLRTSQEMLVFGQRLDEDLATYYLFMNTPLEPADSLIALFFDQYLAYTIVVILAAAFFAVWFSGLLTKPIRKMQKEAVKLSDADYDVHFDGGAFTETKNLASALDTAASELRQTDELRRDLMANVSHDIRTPLTNIRAYAELVRDISGNDPAKREKHLNVIIRETEYLTRLVNEMSELSKMQSGSYVLERENIDLGEKLYDIAEMNEPLIKQADLDVIIEVPEHLIIYADDLKIGEVIQNYLTNAIKHSHADGRIWLRAYRSNDHTVHVEVQDEGEGIAAGDLQKIWDRYQKASRSFTRNGGSTGLGLAIVKAILDAHGAKYGVSSKLGDGSVFWFEIGDYDED